MSWLSDLFDDRRPIPAESAQAAVPISFPEGVRPAWAGATGLYRAVGERPFGLVPDDKPSGTQDSFPAGQPLPQVQAAVHWHTRQGDEVTVGDLVALSVLSFPDAKGRIVGAASDGRVECVLGDNDDPYGTRPRLTVEEENLVMLLRKGVKPMTRKGFDNYRFAWPLTRDPETEEHDGEGGKNEGATETLAA